MRLTELWKKRSKFVNGIRPLKFGSLNNYRMQTKCIANLKYIKYTISYHNKPSSHRFIWIYLILKSQNSFWYSWNILYIELYLSTYIYFKFTVHYTHWQQQNLCSLNDIPFKLSNGECCGIGFKLTKFYRGI